MTRGPRRARDRWSFLLCPRHSGMPFLGRLLQLLRESPEIPRAVILPELKELRGFFHHEDRRLFQTSKDPDLVGSRQLLLDILVVFFHADFRSSGVVFALASI